MSKNYILNNDIDPLICLRHFSWELENNNVTLSWEWPIERTVRLVLVFECEEENPDVTKLIETAHPHEVVMRDLASHYTASIPEGRRKYLICPAYFIDNQNVSVCTSSFTTDWVYQKTEITAQVIYNPLPFSQYQKVTLSITPPAIQQDAITYVIREHGRTIATYPLDSAIMASGGHLYIKKDQTVKFWLHPDYAHLIDMKTS